MPIIIYGSVLKTGLGSLTITRLSPISTRAESNQLKGNAVSVFGNKLYIGTSNGLYSTPLDAKLSDISTNKGNFTEVANTKGKALSLSAIGGHLLIAHQDGAMVLDGNQTKPVTTDHGVWMLKSIPSSGDIIAGTFTGLQLIRHENGNFKSITKIDGIYESLGNLTYDNSNAIWATHPYRGIYKMLLSADKTKVIRYTEYTAKNGLPSTLNNHVYFIKNKILAATEKGVYEYDEAKDKFSPSAFYHPILVMPMLNV